MSIRWCSMKIGATGVKRFTAQGNAVADAMLRPVCPDSLEYRRWLEVPPAVRDMVLAETNLVAPLKSAVTGCMLFPLQRANDDPGGY
ncbi:hypothetical protein V6N13_069792 [Hibiscus sabdariffa]